MDSSKQWRSNFLTFHRVPKRATAFQRSCCHELPTHAPPLCYNHSQLSLVQIYSLEHPDSGKLDVLFWNMKADSHSSRDLSGSQSFFSQHVVILTHLFYLCGSELSGMEQPSMVGKGIPHSSAHHDALWMETHLKNNHRPFYFWQHFPAVSWKRYFKAAQIMNRNRLVPPWFSHQIKSRGLRTGSENQWDQRQHSHCQRRHRFPF